EAAEVSIRAFEEAISGARAMGEVPKEADKEIGETLTETSQEVITSKPRKASAKEKREDEEDPKKIESRLEFLAKMYASSKTERAEKEEET
ncbi:hypothetical protein ACFLX1_02390, partial [Chloroflexota bacterium]